MQNVNDLAWIKKRKHFFMDYRLVKTSVQSMVQYIRIIFLAQIKKRKHFLWIIDQLKLVFNRWYNIFGYFLYYPKFFNQLYPNLITANIRIFVQLEMIPDMGAHCIQWTRNRIIRFIICVRLICTNIETTYINVEVAHTNYNCPRTPGALPYPITLVTHQQIGRAHV